MLERQREDIAKARASGKYGGRKPLKPEIIAQIKELRADEHGPVHIARRLKISRHTVRKYSGGDMRILICGGRQFEDAGFLWKTMDDLHVKTPVTEVIVGSAAGADTLGEHWAKDRRIPYRIFLADWATHGRAAGPIRNQAMLQEGKPDLVVAFSGGKGTANCLKQARAAGVRVWQPSFETVRE